MLVHKVSSLPVLLKKIDDLYKQSRVVCAPILSGGGTCVKIIEAVAYGKPIMSNRIGAEGIEMQDGIEIFLCDDPKLFAKACIKLLTDHERCNQLGSAARNTVIKQYDQIKVKRMIQDIIKDQN